jgi:hypothetical protein
MSESFLTRGELHHFNCVAPQTILSFVCHNVGIFDISHKAVRGAHHDTKISR